MICEFYSGSYATEEEEGIVRVRMDTEAKTMEKVNAHRGIYHPSYLAFNPKKTILYTVQERVPIGAVYALSVTEDGLDPICMLSTNGADPCHVNLDSTGRMLFAANYNSGSLAVFAVNELELPERLSQLIVHEGKGIDPKRQEAPHIHYTREQDGKAYVVDLGLDSIFVYEVNSKEQNLKDTGVRLALPAGAGPRHIEFHRRNPHVAYVICELANRVAVFAEENGKFVMKQYLSTLPDDFAGESTAAAVKMQNNLLFASNRGHDSIAVYQVGEDGMLMLTDIAKTGGKTPRDFTLFGDYLVAANQDSDSITVLQVDWEKGKLCDTGMRFETVRPTCIRKI